MNECQTDNYLEHYLYHRLDLFFSDFLSRDFEAERNIQMFGMVENYLGWDIFWSYYPDSGGSYGGGFRSRAGEKLWNSVDNVVRKQNYMLVDLFELPLPPFVRNLRVPHGLIWNSLERSVYWLRILALSQNCDVMSAFKMMSDLYFEEIDSSQKALPIGETTTAGYPLFWNYSCESARFADQHGVNGIFLLCGFLEDKVVHVPIRSSVPAMKDNPRNAEPGFLPVFDHLLWGMSPVFVKPPSDGVFGTLITDSAMIANRLEKRSDPNSKNGISYASWYGGKDAIDVVQWKSLIFGQPYFLVLDHSGQTIKEACDVALSVYEKVKQNTGRELRFVSCLPKSSDGATDAWSARRMPYAMGFEEFQRFVAYIENNAGAATSIQSCTNQPQLPPRVCLFHPFFFTGTKVLIHGAKNEEKIGFTMALAKRVDCMNFASRSCLAGEWKARSPAGVLYLCDPTIAQSAHENLAGMQSGVYLKTVGYGQGLIDASWVEVVKIDVLNFMKSCRDSSLPAIVFMDGFHWFFSLKGVGQPTIGLREIADIVTVSNGVLVVVVPASLNRKEVGKICKEVGFETVLSVESEMPREAHKVAMTVRIEKCFKMPSSEPKFRKLEFFQPEDQWKFISTKRSIEEEVAIVCKLKNKRMTEKQIEVKTGIPLSRVKERVRRAKAMGLLLPSKPCSSFNPSLFDPDFSL